MFQVFTVIYMRCNSCFCVAPHLPKRLYVFIFLNTKNNRHIWQYRPLQPIASRFSGIWIFSADTWFCTFRQQSALREALRAQDNTNVIWTEVINLINHIFPHYLINGTIFEKKNFTEHKMCFDFLWKYFLKHSHSKKNWTRCDYRYILVFMYSTVIVMTLDLFDRFSQNAQISNLMEIRLVPQSSRQPKNFLVHTL